MKKLHISAGGQNLRIKDFLRSEFNDIPKHILPIPGSTSIIEKIVKDAYEDFDELIIHANSNNHFFFESLFEEKPKVQVVIDYICDGPLGPVISDLETSDTCFACAGDLVCDATWKSFSDFHQSHSMPVSILVAKSIAVPLGAKFTVENKVITSWQRVNYSKSDNLINIGYYIIEKEVLSIIKNLARKDENSFFDALIPMSKIGGYIFPEISFNINTDISYKKMCEVYSKKAKPSV